MSDIDCELAIGLMIILFFGGWFSGCAVNKVEMREDAIKAGVAYYNPTNATFTWKSPNNQ